MKILSQDTLTLGQTLYSVKILNQDTIKLGHLDNQDTFCLPKYCVCMLSIYNPLDNQDTFSAPMVSDWRCSIILTLSFCSQKWGMLWAWLIAPYDSHTGSSTQSERSSSPKTLCLPLHLTAYQSIDDNDDSILLHYQKQHIKERTMSCI